MCEGEHAANTALCTAPSTRAPWLLVRRRRLLPANSSRARFTLIVTNILTMSFVSPEAFCERVIHYYTCGILILPAEITLRIYLAEKLNCDPMRITKKFAGASCLNRSTPVEDESYRSRCNVARAELVHLEQAFGRRIRNTEGSLVSATSERRVCERMRASERRVCEHRRGLEVWRRASVRTASPLCSHLLPVRRRRPVVASVQRSEVHRGTHRSKLRLQERRATRRRWPRHAERQLFAARRR